MTLDAFIAKKMNMLERFKRYAENIPDFDADSGEETDAGAWQDELDYFLNHVNDGR